MKFLPAVVSYFFQDKTAKFTSDLGKAFSVVVLLSGVIFLLVMFPFTVIRFFYAPWLEAHNRARTPRKLPEDMRAHVLLGSFDLLIANLIAKLVRYNYEYAVIVPDQQKALELYNQDYKVVAGVLDDINTYRNARADKAALVMFNNDDHTNTHAVFTLRELSRTTPIVSAANSFDSIFKERIGSMRIRLPLRAPITGRSRCMICSRFHLGHQHAADQGPRV